MWEIGKSMPRADKLPALAKILGCTISDLYSETSELEEDKCIRL